MPKGEVQLPRIPRTRTSPKRSSKKFSGSSPVGLLWLSSDVSCVASGSALANEEYEADRDNINNRARQKGSHTDLYRERNGNENHKHKKDSEHVEERVRYSARGCVRRIQQKRASEKGELRRGLLITDYSRGSERRQLVVLIPQSV